MVKVKAKGDNMTVSEFLYEFVEKYGAKCGVASTYDGNVDLLENYGCHSRFGTDKRKAAHPLHTLQRMRSRRSWSL